MCAHYALRHVDLDVTQEIITQNPVTCLSLVPNRGVNAAFLHRIPQHHVPWLVQLISHTTTAGLAPRSGISSDVCNTTSLIIVFEPCTLEVWLGTVVVGVAWLLLVQLWVRMPYKSTCCILDTLLRPVVALTFLRSYIRPSSAKVIRESFTRCQQTPQIRLRI